MPNIKEEYLLRPTSTPEQINFISQFFAKFNTSNGANKKIINVEPLYYVGAYAGTEFLTYAANKLYLVLNMEYAYLFSSGVVGEFINFLDETNANFYVKTNFSGVDSAGANRFNNDVITNFYFSRTTAAANAMTWIKFNGYRITLQ